MVVEGMIIVVVPVGFSCGGGDVCVERGDMGRDERSGKGRGDDLGRIGEKKNHNTDCKSTGETSVNEKRKHMKKTYLENRWCSYQRLPWTRHQHRAC